MDIQKLIELGEAHFQAGDRSGLTACFNQAQAAQPDSIPAAFLWCLVKVLEDRGADIAQIIRDGDHSNLRLLNSVCNKLLDGSHFEALGELNTSLSDRPSGIIPCYYLACYTISQGRWEDGCRMLEQFRSRLPSTIQTYGIEIFITDEEINVVLRQGRLCVGPNEVEQRVALWRESPPFTPAIVIEMQANAPGRTYLCACNGAYFDAMGETFVRGLLALPNSNAHIHVIDPNEPVLSLSWVEEISSSGRLGLSTETSPPVKSATYFACSRFYVVPYFLDLYQQPLVSLDLDIVPNNPEFDVHLHAAHHDFCCFVTERNEPASIMQASVMVWANSAETRRYCSELQAFCFPELDNPSMMSWMLDQAALICIKEARNLSAEPLRFGDLTQLTGELLENHISEIADEAERHRLKNIVYPFEPRQIRL